MAHVNNIFDLAKHVSHHRKRVYTLGMHLTNQNITRNKSMLAARLVFGLHDIEKYIFLPWLWKYYGGKGDKTEARKLYTRMNKVGAFIIATALLVSFKFKTHSLKQLKFFEKIVDVIDRHCDPVAMEEFDLKKKRPLTQFLSVKELPLAIKVKKKWLELFEKP